MNTEEELFFPTLTVSQTMDFATRIKVPFHLPNDVTSAEAYRTANRDFLLESMVSNTLTIRKLVTSSCVAFSGGERKRVQLSKPSLHGAQSSAGITAREVWMQAPPWNTSKLSVL